MIKSYEKYAIMTCLARLGVGYDLDMLNHVLDTPYLDKHKRLIEVILSFMITAVVIEGDLSIDSSEPRKALAYLIPFKRDLLDRIGGQNND